jgi:hypothetical protein
MSALLTTPPRATEGVSSLAEWCDAKRLKPLFGLSRSHAYLLLSEGLIRAASIRSRPTLRTPEIENILIEAAETGAPIKACCATARISYETFRAWCMSDPELAFQFYQARERGRVNALSILQQAAKEDWRAAAEWLRLAHRESYSTRAEISVEGAPKQDEGIVIDAVMLTRLQGADIGRRVSI